jgi:hypothetical protein
MAAALEALENLSADPDAQRLAREREDALRLHEIGLAHDRREARAEGRAEALKETILLLSTTLGIELTHAQRTSLDDPGTDLAAIRDALIRERRWP